LAYESFLTDDDVDAAFGAYDSDKSGALDFEEFQRLIEDGLLLSEPLSEYERLFREADRSGNGALGAAELKSLLKAMGRDASDDKLVDIFGEYDLDGSGQVELREFLRMCARRLLDVRALKEWMRTRPSGDQQEAAAAATDGSSAGASAVAAVLAPEEEPGNVTVIFSAEELEEALNKAGEEGVVALMCGLSWCRPCKGVAPNFSKLSDRYAKATNGKLTSLKIYGNANERTKAVFKKLKIRSTPAFVFFRGGKVASAVTGANKGRLETAIRGALGLEEEGEDRMYPPERKTDAGGVAAGVASSGSGSE
jgi:thiol-disulfide isomerase/thioredoxin